MESTSDNISSLNSKQLQDFIIYVLNTTLKYRDNLDIDKEITFGIEIEYESINKYLIDRYIRKNYPSWIVKKDESLIMGSEIVSPILNDETINWKKMKEICDYLKSKHVITTDNAAGHIHIGAHILGKDLEKWRKFIKTYTIYEDVLFRFLYGDKVSARKGILDYSIPISDLLVNRLEKINKLEDIFQIKNVLPPYSKRQAINFMNINVFNIDSHCEKNTVEFRCPNATVDKIVWQNNINTLINLIVNSENIDEDLLNYKIKDCTSEKSIYTYNEIYLRKVLEFVDLIFDNNLDKIYFLKQYLKEFQQSSNLPFEKRYIRR